MAAKGHVGQHDDNRRQAIVDNAKRERTEGYMEGRDVSFEKKKNKSNADSK